MVTYKRIYFQTKTAFLKLTIKVQMGNAANQEAIEREVEGKIRGKNRLGYITTSNE